MPPFIRELTDSLTGCRLAGLSEISFYIVTIFFSHLQYPWSCLSTSVAFITDVSVKKATLSILVGWANVYGLSLK